MCGCRGVRWNKLTGTVPTEIGRLTALAKLCVNLDILVHECCVTCKHTQCLSVQLQTWKRADMCYNLCSVEVACICVVAGNYCTTS